MSFSDGLLKEKSLAFSKRLVSVYQFLTEEKKEYVLSKQVLRSGTSIGANIAESACAISRKDFLSKLYIAFEECAETQYWLELLSSCGYLTPREYASLKADCDELYRLLSSATKTIKEGRK